MKQVTFSVNGSEFTLQATSLHTALHRLGEILEQRGYSLNTANYLKTMKLSIVLDFREIKVLPRLDWCGRHKKEFGTCTPTDEGDCWKKTIIKKEETK